MIDIPTLRQLIREELLREEQDLPFETHLGTIRGALAAIFQEDDPNAPLVNNLINQIVSEYKASKAGENIG